MSFIFLFVSYFSPCAELMNPAFCNRILPVFLWCAVAPPFHVNKSMSACKYVYLHHILYVKIRSSCMIAKETTLHRRSNELTTIVYHLFFNNLKNKNYIISCKKNIKKWQMQNNKREYLQQPDIWSKPWKMWYLSTNSVSVSK